MKIKFYLLSLLLFIACKKNIEIGPKPVIITFIFPNIISSQAVIDEIKKTISITLPYNTNIAALAPKIEINSGAKIVPASGIAQDFKKNIYYTVTSKDGQKKIYTVIVTLSNQPIPEITSFTTDTVEAGLNFHVVGNHFGNYGLDVKTYLIDASKKQIEVNHIWVDSTKININSDIETVPGLYQIKIKVKNQETISSKKIRFSYPSPQLSSVDYQNYVNSDTVWVKGKYIDSSKYKFQLQLESEKKNIKLPLVFTKAGLLAGVIPADLEAKNYSLKLFNVSENKVSGGKNIEIEIFDATKPFVKEIINPKTGFKNGETILFKTINFDTFEARFYQISLAGPHKTFIQNGIYDKSKKTLSLVLPETILKGQYSIHFGLTEPSKNIDYSFKSNLKIEIKD